MNFLRESWEHAAESQRQQVRTLSERVRVFLDLENTVKNIPSEVPEETRKLIKEYFDNVVDSAFRYIESVNVFTKGKLQVIDRRDTARNDEARRRMHDGLISNLTVLERLMKKHGLDTSWRSVVGSDRKRIQEWAQETVDHLVETQKEENGGTK